MPLRLPVHMPHRHLPKSGAMGTPETPVSSRVPMRTCTHLFVNSKPPGTLTLMSPRPVQRRHPPVSSGMHGLSLTGPPMSPTSAHSLFPALCYMILNIP